MSLTKKEKLYLKENFQTTTNVELAKFLNYHPKSILMVLNRLKLKRTPEEIKNILSKTPVNKILLTGEELDYLKSNYNCLSNVKLSKKFKVSTKTIQRILLSLNLHRSKGEQLHLILMSRSKMEIENSKRSIFQKWVKINGSITKNKILVYKYSDSKQFEDLVLINKTSYTSFLNSRISKEEFLLQQKLKEQKNVILVEKKAYKLIENQRLDRKRLQREINDKRHSDLLSNHKQHSYADIVNTLKAEDKVPIKIDHKTTIYVKKSKCQQLPDGSWIKIIEKTC